MNPRIILVALVFLEQKHNLPLSERLQQNRTMTGFVMVPHTGTGKSLIARIPFSNAAQSNLVSSQQQMFSSLKSYR